MIIIHWQNNYNQSLGLKDIFKFSKKLENFFIRKKKNNMHFFIIIKIITNF